MKRFFIISVFIILCGGLNAQYYGNYIPKTKVPVALNIRFGDSELSGILSTEFQVSRFSISGGWRPFTLTEINRSNGYFEIKHLHSFGISATIYGKPWYESSLYLTGGLTNYGWSSRKLFSWNEIAEPSGVLMIGYKSIFGDMCPGDTERLSLNFANGIKTNGIKVMFVFEALINFTLWKN